MPAAAHTGAIAFGLVYIPIKMYTAISENQFSFNQLNRKTGNRIGYKKYDKGTGEEVSSDDIIKGYEYTKGQYVTMTEDELDALKAPKDKALTITQFVEAGSIHPLLLDKAYYVVPDGGNKAYALLREAMLAEGCVAIATTVLGTKDTVLALSPAESGIMAQTLHYQAEIKPMPMPVATGSVETSENEMSMSKMLLQSMRSEFDPAAYHDATEQKVRQAIEAKINGQQTVQPQAETNIVDLMDALQRSLVQQGQQGLAPPMMNQVH
jgi:DNA end-binding protein Ku